MKARFMGMAAIGAALLLVGVVVFSMAGSGTPAALAQAATGTPRPGIVTVPTVTGTVVSGGGGGSVTPVTPTATAVLPSAGTITRTTAPTNTAIGAARGPLSGTITVVGEGKVSIKPDIARVNVGVESVQPTVQEASAQTKTVMDAVIKAIKGKGVADKDIQTSNFSIFTERIQPTDSKSGQGPTVYHVSNQVALTIRDLNQVSDLLDAAIAAGANNIYGVNFSVEDPTRVESVGRQAAVADALRRAKELATLNGVQLTGVVSVSEVIGNQGSYVANSFRDTATGRGGGGGGPILPGEMELTMQLQVTYGIQ